MTESRHGTHPWALAIIAVLIAVSQPLNFHSLVVVCELFFLARLTRYLGRFSCLFSGSFFRCLFPH